MLTFIKDYMRHLLITLIYTLIMAFIFGPSILSIVLCIVFSNGYWLLLLLTYAPLTAITVFLIDIIDH